MDFSVIIITLNEERNIARCIDSVIDLTDDIIVIDSGSTDNTEEIVRSKKVSFYQTEWKSYGTSRNIGAGMAKHDYILALDADEAPSEELRISLMSLLENEGAYSDLYSFNRLTNYCGTWIKHSGWYPDVKARLYNKTLTKWDDEPVHEVLLKTESLSKEHLKGDLLHYSYYSQKEHRERADKYSRLTAIKMAKKNRPSWPFSPYMSMIAKFISMYIIRLGFLDGKAGYDIAKISALSNHYKYAELRRINSLKTTAHATEDNSK